MSRTPISPPQPPTPWILLAVQLSIGGFLLLLMWGKAMTLDCYDLCASSYRLIDVGFVVVAGLGTLALVLVSGQLLRRDVRLAVQAGLIVATTIVGFATLSVRP